MISKLTKSIPIFSYHSARKRDLIMFALGEPGMPKPILINHLLSLIS